jgi:hypothetical protein
VKLGKLGKDFDVKRAYTGLLQLQAAAYVARILA